MHTWTRKIQPIVWCFFLLGSVHGSADKLQPRSMDQYQKIGIRFEVYSQPLWEPTVDSSNRYSSVIINSPENHFPIVQYNITPFPDMRVNNREIHAVALSAMKTAKTRFGRKPIIVEERFVKKTRGIFSGYETTFDAHIEGIDISVLYFVGKHDIDNRLISMSAQTQKGRLPHIREHVRRTFDWVDYLD